MTCDVCGKEGCHPNYHKSIMQIVEECGPEESVRVLTDLLLHASGASVADRARLVADRFIYGVAVEDQEGRRVDPTTIFLRGDGTYTIVPVLGSTSPAQLRLWEHQPESTTRSCVVCGQPETEARPCGHAYPVTRYIWPSRTMLEDLLEDPAPNSSQDVRRWPCPTCGGETVVELGQLRRRCVAHPEHDT